MVCPYSDHDFIIIKFTTFSAKTSHLWKFDNSLLKDPNFCNQLNDLLFIWNNRVYWYASINKWWDALKAEIRRFSKRFSFMKQKALLSEKTRLKEFLKLRLKALLGVDGASRIVKYYSISYAVLKIT